MEGRKGGPRDDVRSEKNKNTKNLSLGQTTKLKKQQNKTQKHNKTRNKKNTLPMK